MFLAKVRQFLDVGQVGTNTTEGLIAALGGGLSILLLVGFSLWLFPVESATPVIASMGASAVLLFVLPHGPLSQPWPVLAGHSISALIGVTCARYIPQPAIAAACAVGLAIAVMHQCKCIHPPGGATAFAAVIGGSAIRQLGFWFVLFPVLTNAIVMVVLAVIINSVFHGRRYPATRHGGPSPAPSAPARAPLTQAEVVAAIKALDAPVEMSENEMRRRTELLASKG